eukprot:4617980-Pleurochrysis_carterae.AAC.4
MRPTQVKADGCKAKRQIGRQRDRRIDAQVHRHAGTQARRQAGRRAGAQARRRAGRQAGAQAGRCTDIQRASKADRHAQRLGKESHAAQRARAFELPRARPDVKAARWRRENDAAFATSGAFCRASCVLTETRLVMT